MNLHQCQSSGRCGGTCQLAVTACQNLRYTLRLPVSLSNLHQRTGNDPYHIIEKSISCNAEDDQVSLLLHIQRIDCSYCRLHLGARRTEALKIVFPDQIGSRLSHPLHIKLPICKMRIEPISRQRKFPVQDPVLIWGENLPELHRNPGS